MNIEKEDQLYDHLLDWIEEKFEYYVGGFFVKDGKYVLHKNMGASKKCRLDVIGVKNVGAQVNALADELEIIGIEVKFKDSVSYQDLAQAAGYKIFVHKACLATTGIVTEEVEHWARILGIGLIRIEIKPTEIFFESIIEAPIQSPNHSEMLRLLRRLGIGECTLCKCFFHLLYKWDSKRFSAYLPLQRIKWINTYFSINENDNYIDLLDNPNKAKAHETISRYICRPCANLLGLEIKGDIEDFESNEE